MTPLLRPLLPSGPLLLNGLLASAAALLAAGPVLAGEAPVLPPPSATGPQRLTSVLPSAAAAELDGLFARLAEARDAQTAQGLEQRIEARWALAGDGTVRLLLDWSGQAIAAGQDVLALDFLDQAIAADPGLAEPYFRRAVVRAGQGDISPAIGDLQTLLRIEPRHYRGLMLLASLLTDLDQNERALSILKRIQAIDPHLAGLDEAIETIVASRHGRDI